METPLGTLERVRDVPLDKIPLRQAQQIRRRIVNREADVPPVEVAAFGSHV